MLKRLLVIAVAATFAAGLGYADRSKKIVNFPVNKPRPPAAARCLPTIARHAMGWMDEGTGRLPPR